MKKTNLENLHFLVGQRDQITNYLLSQIEKKNGFMVLPASLNDLASISEDPALKTKYGRVDYCVTDGMPLVWFFNWRSGLAGQKADVQRVYGPTLMKNLLIKGNSRIKHFLFGSSPETITQLGKEISGFAPQTKIVGQISPPFRNLTMVEEVGFINEIKKAGTNVLWLGLSSPKQVVLAVRWQRLLPGVSIFCVGAAFDFLAKRQAMAPSLIQGFGLEWLFRLLVDPKRLWKRYLVTIPSYLLSRLFRSF